MMVPMKMRLALLALTAMVDAPVFAQEPVVGVADPDALFHNKDKKLDKNLQSPTTSCWTCWSAINGTVRQMAD